MNRKTTRIKRGRLTWLGMAWYILASTAKACQGFDVYFG